MARPFVPQIVSANDLMTGDVVYLSAGGAFTRNIAEAVVAIDAASAETVLSWAEAAPDRVVGPYLVAVDTRPGAPPRPRHHREEIRERGPTHLPEFDRTRTSDVPL